MLNNLTHLRAFYRILLLVFGTLGLCLVQVLWCFVTIGRMVKSQSPVVRVWYRYVLWLSGTHVTVVNKRWLAKKQQKIFLSNHISYMDIMVLGAYFDCFFVAKSDIAGWPIFGSLAKIGGTIFITRQRQFVKLQVDLLRNHMKMGQSLLIFPEGTTSNGREVKTFKSSLLKSVFDIPNPPVIQPLSLVYTHINGKKLNSEQDFDQIAWYGDMTLLPHLWHLFRQKKVSAKVVIHPSIPVGSQDVKQLTTDIHYMVDEAFHRLVPPAVQE